MAKRTKELREVEKPNLGIRRPQKPRPLFAVNWLGYFEHITAPPWASISSAYTERLEFSEF